MSNLEEAHVGCFVCGEDILIGEEVSYTCTECGVEICEACYDESDGTCPQCMSPMILTEE